MKILMILESIFTGDTRVENEALSLISESHEVGIICYSTTSKSIVEHYKNIKLYRLGISKFIRKSSVAALSFPVYFNFWKKHILKILTSENYDVIHVHDLPLISICYDIAKEKRLKLVLDLHENYPALLEISEHTKTIPGRLLCSVRKWEAYERTFVNMVDHIIVVIEEAKTRLIKLGVDPDKIEIVSNYLKFENYAQFTKQPRQDGKIVFVYLGGVTFHRGLQYVLEAARLINDLSDRFSVKIIGDGRYVAGLKRMVDQYGLKNICFTGWLSEYEAFEKLSDGDVALIPHIKTDHTDNTIPHKLFFYMYYGFPVISSDCNPIKRILEESGSGITFPSGDFRSLAQIMRSFITDPSEMKKYSDSNNAVRGKYNWEPEAKKLLSLYRKLNNTRS
jgi:glycosyltransferase involved in cell wall biosynthesis